MGTIPGATTGGTSVFAPGLARGLDDTALAFGDRRPSPSLPGRWHQRGSEINQIHRYPGGARTLDCRAFDPGCSSVLGEFATAPDDVWPDLRLGDQQVLHRLRLARAQGCPLAMPWSFLGRDRHTVWSNEVERDIETFILEEQAEDQ